MKLSSNPRGMSHGLLFVVLLLLVSCTKEAACESNATGTLLFENTNTTATLQIFINEFGTIAVNAAGDLSVAPGESQSMDLPAGPQNVKARFTTAVCNGGRCQTSTSGLPEREVDLEACDALTLSY